MRTKFLRTKPPRRRLRCENLESRCLLAGDLTLQLLTNQVDVASASQAQGIEPGTYIEWSYKVTNNGLDTFVDYLVFVTDDNGTPNQPLDDVTTNDGAIYLELATDVGSDNLLSPGESWTFTSWRLAQTLNQGIYANTATVTAGTNTASDSSFYASPQPGVDIQKLTNGQDADTVGAAVPLFPGAPITWTYQVTNIGNVLHSVQDVYVIDNNGTPAVDTDDFDVNSGITLIPSAETADGVLSPGETWLFSASSVALDLGTTAPAPIVVEAESLNQTGFTLQSSTTASGGQIQRLGLFDGSGELWTAFAGATNTYDIKVFAQDEGDGVSTIDVSVAGTNVGTIVLDQDSDGGGDDNGTYSEFVLPGIAINELDEVRLAVQGNAGELVRIDKLEFIGGEINATYGNRGEVWVSSEVSDFDLSHYTNPEIQPAKLGNFVFSDINMNGIQDFGEAGVPDITVTLTGGGADGVIGTADDTTEVQQTTELGVYLFRDLIPGDEYQVSFSDLPEGYEFSPADQGIDDGLDSDVDTAGQTQIIVLGSDEDNRSIDAGIFETVIPGAIGDFVFSDVSRDGIRDVTEVGVPDVTVTLAGGGADGVLGTADDTTATQQTVADGSYKFEGLTPGVEYQVTFSNLPAGFEFTQANEGTDDLLDSDAVPLTGVTPVIVLANGEEDLSVDAGIIESIVPSSIGDFVFLDVNRDGVQDEGETGFANITVTLTGAGPDGLLDTLDDTTATRITDPDGFYEFGDLDEFTELYKLTFSGVPTGFEFSPLDQGTDDALDSDVDPLTGMTASFVLTNGENNANMDAGIFETVVPGSIGDFVFFDVDEDGLQDEEETGVPNVTVTLTGGGADGVLGTLDDTTTAQQTDINGFYNFTGLNPGEEYRVAFSDLPVDYAFTLADQGLNDEADSDPDPLTGQSGIIVLANGEQNTSVDAGIFVPTIEGSIGNFVFFDTDEDGIQDEGELGFPNVMVTLTGGGLDGVIGTPDDTTQSKLSSADGFYVFNELNPGEEYQITFSFMELGFGFTQQDVGEDDGIDSDADPLTGQTEILVLATSEDNVSVDAGVISVPIPPAALGNQVFVDENQNGQRDANEPGLSKVGVTLTGGGEDGVIGTDDDTTATTTTDRQGKYNFTDLNPLEEYQVAFDLPTGYEFTAANAAGDKVDSDADPATGLAPLVVLQPDQFDKSIDAGFVPLPSRLGNRVFQDSNANGRQDAGEVGVANVVVTLAGGGADKILGTADDTTATTTTNRTGLYYFDGLTTGVEYQVSFELPTGYEFTLVDAVGDKADSDADPLTGAAPIIVLKPGTVDRSVDAGLVPLPGSIGDQVFWDTNRNGIRDRGEDNVADVTVTLTSGGPDLVIGSADDVTTVQVTDINGNYTFENLDTKAEHQIAFSNLPVGFEFTIQDATIENRDSDANPETGITEIINLKPGQAKVNVDAGLVESFTPGIVNSFVFSDTNGNGIQEIGELGVPNVTVTLVGGGFDAVVGTTDDSTDQQITDENGAFSFGNLIPDREYQIVFSNLPAGFVFTKQDVGTDDLDSDATPTTGASQPFVMADGAAVDVDAGIVVSAPGLIGNLIFDDVDRDGVQDSGESGISGVTVFLFGGGPDKLIGTADDTATTRLTNINGAYTFSALNPGEEYQVFIPSLPTGKEFTLVGQGTRADRDSDFDPETGRSPVIVLHSGEENRDIDAGLIDTVVVPTGLIGNKVWEDLDADGFQDANEPGVAGVTITLTSAGADGIMGTEDDTTISRNTNNSGVYAFSGLVAGQYMVTFSNLPAGYSLTIKDAPGVDEARDSDADPITGATDIILLGIGEENRDMDAGLILIPPVAADAVFGAE